MSLFRHKRLKKHYGLDLGNGTMKLVELIHDTRANRLQLGRFLVKATPAAAIVNGVIQDRARLTAALSEIRREFGASSLAISTALTGQSLVVRQIRVPRMPADEFRQVLQLQADRYFGMPAQRLAVDFRIIDELPDNQMSVFLVGSPRQPILELVELLRENRIQTLRVDIEPLAALRSLRLSDGVPQTAADETVLILDLGAGTSNLSIFHGDQLQLVRVIDLGGKDLTEAIARDQQVEWEEAEALKRQYGIVAGSPIHAAVDPVMQRWMNQVILSLEYYQIEHREAPIHQVALVGGGARLLGLQAALERNIGEMFTRLSLEPPEIRLGNPCAQLELTRDAELAQEQGPVLAVAIGLALGEVMADATS
ncbi:MAG: type IV pilus assembly protein PilM [Bacillota bacterium]|jgi:type IV pilus assembly protein PilM